MAVAAIVGVVAAAGATVVGVTIGTAVAIGLAAASIYATVSMKKPTPGATPSQSERKQLIRSSTAPKQVIVGKTLVSGVWLYAEEQKGGSENPDGTYKEWLFNAIGIAGHPVYRVLKCYFNETPIEEYGEFANWQVHNNPTATDSYLLENGPSWKKDMIGKGTTWARISMLFDNDKYPNGIPTPRFLVEGVADVYDPRTRKKGFTDNAALVTLWVLQNYFNCSNDEIIWNGFGGFSEAANLCDEIVINPDGSTEKRYTVNGSFLLDEKRGDILSDLLRSYGAELVRVGGRVGVLPAAYYGPATFTIHESDIISDIDLQPEPDRSNATNVVGGTFIDPTQNYVETDYPQIRDDEAIARDGEEIKTDLNFRFVTSPYQAQRLANIELKRAKAGAVVRFTMGLKGLYCRRGRVVNLDVPSVGLIGEYRVVSCGYHLAQGVEIVLQQDDIDIYDDAVGGEFVAPPLVNLPNGDLAAPVNVRFLAEALGDVVQGKLVWQTRASSAVINEIRIDKQHSDGRLEAVQYGQSVGDTYNLNGLPVADYVASVRSKSASGKLSAWASSSFVVSMPKPPDAVQTKSSNWSINLVPQFKGSVPVGTLFEFWHLADPSSFLAGVPEYSADDLDKATKVHTGSSFSHSGLIPDRYQHYWVRTVNVYGASDFLYLMTGTTREQALVTTLVERLESIEIVSSNYVAGKSGYRIFPANPNDPTQDGKAEFNNIIARGHIEANTGHFKGSLDVASGNTGARMRITNERIDVYSSTGALKVRIGKL
ncbi:phage tail tip protein J-related protein [Vibrio cholerae]